MIWALIPQGYTKFQKNLIKMMVLNLYYILENLVLIDFYKTNKLKNLFIDYDINIITFEEYESEKSFYETVKSFEKFLKQNKVKEYYRRLL